MRLFRMFGLDRERRGLTRFALLALLVLGLGAVVHLEHHLFDPACESGQGRESHPCVSCSSLHGSALVEQFSAPEPWRLAAFTEHHALAEPAPSRRAWVSASPRAPPLS